MQTTDPTESPPEFTRSPYGYTHPERDKREMCPYCYNEDTTRITGADAIPYEKHHQGKPFRAFECRACSGKFHFAI